MPHSFNFAILLVVTSGLFHALWNICTKKSINKEAFLFSVQLTSLIAFLPICLPLIMKGNFSNSALLIFACSALAHGFYFLLLARLYTISELSQSYPIIRGSSLLIIPLCGVIFLGEKISVIGWIGISIIICGIILISEIRLARLNNKTLLLSLGVGASIALYILIDKIALQYIDPVSLNQIGTLGNVIILAPIIFHHRLKTFKNEWKINYKLILIGAVLAPSSYMLFLWAIKMAPISVLAPLREIGTVFGAMIGVYFLKESNKKNRVMASVIITCGMLLLGFFH